ncbi:MAG TPA: alpha/beta hydrolase [Myxococcota bacterium]|nr:alpha/beta hydrolase [Myxococcota bacterium]
MSFNSDIKIDIPGFTIAAKTFGNPLGKPVLCFHGMLDNAASFELLLPLLTSSANFIAFDLPGVGLSSHYPKGALPNWKNDACLMLHVVKALNLERCDVIAHSYGSLVATYMAVAQPDLVERMTFLDILGPKVNFIENYIANLRGNVEAYLQNRVGIPVFADREAAIKERMKLGPIGYQSAEALVNRGTRQTGNGIMWTFDPALQFISSTLPLEDEIMRLFGALTAPICLIRADKGVPYPENIWLARSRAIQNLTVIKVSGGHHVHMDDPTKVAPIISQFLFD